MAIPIGTTSRQLAAVARWMLAGVVMSGMLMLWWPSYRTWGVLTAGLLAVWTLWLAWKTVSADRSVGGNPVYLAFLAPVAILTYHLAGTGLGTQHAEGLAMAGAMNMSMIFQIALLALGVMLAGELLPAAASHAGVLSVCGLAMIGGSVAAMTWGQADAVRGALAMLGFGGVGVWLCPLWGFAPGGSAADSHALGRNELRAGCVAVAVISAVLLAVVAPFQALLAGGVVAATLVLGGIVLGQHRRGLAIAGAALGAIVLCIAMITRPEIDLLKRVPAGAFGRGEAAFIDVSAADSGMVVLGATIGWAGLLWFMVGLFACLVWLLGHARKGRGGDQGRAIVWSAATAITSCAMFAPGGLFIPAVVPAVALTWGLLPAMLGRVPPKRPSARSGGILVAAMVGLMALLGLAKRDGLAFWMAQAFGFGEVMLHGLAGFLVAMVLAWFMGGRRLWAGLAGIALAALAGGAGEIVQYAASTRTPELGDWLAHAVGSAAAIVPYLLCVGSRWCESIDAAQRGIRSHDRYR